MKNCENCLRLQKIIDKHCDSRMRTPYTKFLKSAVDDGNNIIVKLQMEVARLRAFEKAATKLREALNIIKSTDFLANASKESIEAFQRLDKEAIKHMEDPFLK